MEGLLELLEAQKLQIFLIVITVPELSLGVLQRLLVIVLLIRDVVVLLGMRPVWLGSRPRLLKVREFV